jgi:hypothetical protein
VIQIRHAVPAPTDRLRIQFASGLACSCGAKLSPGDVGVDSREDCVRFFCGACGMVIIIIDAPRSN